MYGPRQLSYPESEGLALLPLSHSRPHSLALHSNALQIADAYRRWGITPGKTKDLIVVKVVPPPSAAQGEVPTQQAIWDHLRQNVQGRPTLLADIEFAQTTDWPKVRKYYRLNGVPALERLSDEQERRKQSERLAIMGMALRGL